MCLLALLKSKLSKVMKIFITGGTLVLDGPLEYYLKSGVDDVQGGV